MTPDTEFTWDLDVDMSWFVPLPAEPVAALAPGAADAWIDAALARYAEDPEIDARSAALLRITAEALLGQGEAGVTRLWFAPQHMYSDLLVTISVARSDGPGNADSAEVFEGATYSAGFDLLPLRTETHGAGFLVRRSTQTGGPDTPLITQWTVRLNNGTWSILVDTLGTTLPAFIVFEEQLMRLITGIVLPRPVDAL